MGVQKGIYMENALKLSGILWMLDADKAADTTDVYTDHYDERAKQFLRDIDSYPSHDFDSLTAYTHKCFPNITHSDVIRIASFVCMQR